MTNEDMSSILQKTATYIEQLEAENTRLKKFETRTSVKQASASLIEKLGKATGFDEDKVIDMLESLSDEHKNMIEKISSDEFNLGGSSSYSSTPKNAEEAFIDFCSN